MKRLSRLTACVAMLAMPLFLVAATARGQVLDQLPGDSVLVIRVKNLAAVNDKAAALAKQFGIVEMKPEAADPLGALLGEMGIKDGIDRGGDAALAIVSADFDAPEPPMIALFPITDYATFLKNFGDPKKDGAYDVIHIAGDAQDTYAIQRGKYAAISPKKEHLDRRADGFKPTGVTARELESKDIVAVTNFKVLGPKLGQMLAGNKEAILAKVEQAIAGEPKFAKYAPLAKAVVSRGLWVADEFLKGADSSTLSANLNKEGIALGGMVEFTADSYFGKTFGAIKSTTAPLLAGLPDAKYLIFGGSITGGDAGRQMLADIFGPIYTELGRSGDELKPVLALMDGFKEMVSATTGQTLGLIAPTAALGAGSLIQSVVITRGDAKAILAAQPKLMEAEQKLMAMIPNQPETKITFTPAAKTVEGVEFAQFTTDITGTDAIALQAKSMMTMMYGPGGATGLSGVVDPGQLLIVLGVDDATLSAAIKAVRDHSDFLSKQDGVALVTRNLPQSRLAVGYIALDQIVITVTNYAKMMGFPIPINMKPDLPPIGFSVGTEGTAIRADAYVPADTVEQMIATVLQLKMMGGGRGKPGGL